MSRPIPFDEYLAIDAVNWSTLKEMRKSPAHYQHRLKNPRQDTTRLGLGRAIHTAVFEPDRFMIEYACYKGAVRRGKKWDAFKEAHEHETILKLPEYQLCLNIRDAVRSHPVAMEYLRQGSPEHTVKWLDKKTDLPCKGRLDWISESKPAVVDLKSTKDVSSENFAKVMVRLGYHIQLAYYRDGLAFQRKGDVLPVKVIAVEIEPPHDVAVFNVDEDTLHAGFEEYKELLQKVVDCKTKMHWPGRYQEEQVLRLPSWAFDEEDQGIDGLDLVINKHNGEEVSHEGLGL